MTAQEALEAYINSIDKQWRTDHATEHTYRGALASLLSSLRPGLQVINEPKRIECGAPDYIILKNGMPLAFVEAKDIGDSDLDGNKLKGGNKEQFDRYKSSLAHIAFTDYLDFHFYEKGEFVSSVRIGEIKGDHISLVEENVDLFTAHIGQMLDGSVQPIKSAKQLAQLMAAKARLLEQIALKLLLKTTGHQTGIQKLMAVFNQALIPDTDAKAFADVYAQTLTYGLFAARLHDETPETFTRHEAMDLIPKSNPFLKELFVYIGTKLESELEWIVDDLVMMFGASDIRAILKDYGKVESKRDPMIRFYEDFLTSYDSGLRRERGVWYTPLPVVKFIVSAVDEILEKTFGLQDGLANRDKVDIKIERERQHGRRATETVTENVHKVQVLDPATGTGTFLAECVNRIHGRFANNQGKWNDYVSKDLLPRLNGFEILMASYTMAHVKLDCVLANTGYVHQGDQRFNVFLTNSLEEYAESMGQLFAFALGEEAIAARFVKRDCPVMVVMGNPPYSGISKNNGEWITKLVSDYKREPGTTEKLKERKNWLNDDYVKFIRLAESYVERNGSGVVAFINNHGLLDNPTFRGMRWHLLNTFDEIYIVNLHGNSMKHEKTPEGGKDENVFSITVGTTINIFVKTGKKNIGELAKVRYADVYGKRKEKFEFLESHKLSDVEFVTVNPIAPYYFCVPKDFTLSSEYMAGFGLGELMTVSNTAILTMGDSFAVAQTKVEMLERIEDLNGHSYTEAEIKSKYGLGKNYAAFLKSGLPVEIDGRIEAYSYRPFDTRWICFSGKTIWRQRLSVMKHILAHENTAMTVCKQSATDKWTLVSVTDKLVDDCYVSSRTKERGYVFPLYLYNDNMGQIEKVPNFNAEIYGKICEAISVEAIAPEDVFDYIYAVLHAPEYREKYKEFLKVDFPRIPYPKNAEMFGKLVACGRELRQAHLLKDTHSQSEQIASFPVTGENVVEGVRWDSNRVYFNETQYFDNVPKTAFDFWIGGYQPAQKWLKDRKGRPLTNDDCDHYQSIILSLLKTESVMKQLSELSSEWL